MPKPLNVIFLFLRSAGLIIALTLSANGSADDRESIGNGFLVFDATAYKDKPDLSVFGMRPMIKIYQSNIWQGQEDRSQLPSEQWIKHMTEWYAFRQPDRPVFLNVEHWATDTLNSKVTEENVSRNLERLATIVRWMHEVEPDLRIGYYGILPMAEYAGPVREIGWRLAQAEKANHRLLESDLADEVDIVYPNLYVRYSDDIEDWKKWALWTIEQARRFDKPVYPFIWPRFHTAGPKEISGKYIPAEFWREMLEFCREHADGVVIWGGWLEGRETWNPQAPWWLETQEFLNELEARQPNG